MSVTHSPSAELKLHSLVSTETEELLLMVLVCIPVSMSCVMCVKLNEWPVQILLWGFEELGRQQGALDLSKLLGLRSLSVLCTSQAW